MNTPPAIEEQSLRFEAELRAGKVARMEDFLPSLPFGATDELAEQLCLVEIEHELRHDRSVSEAALRKRLPEFRRAVSAAFTSARAKYPQHSERLVPDPGKTDQGLLDVFFKSTNVLTPAQFHESDDFSDVEIPEAEVQLKVVKGPHSGREFVFRNPVSVLVGRSADSHLQLIDDEKCSRLHCRFEISPPNCSLVDLKSTNGTLVNAELVDRCTLQDGDTVQVGRTKIRVHIQDARKASDTANQRLAEQTYNPSLHAPALPGYEIGDLIGRGRFGVVYAGHHLSTGRKVAVKILSRSAIPSGDEVQQFIREASICVGLKHPQIVETVDFGVHDDTPYLVFEFIDTIDIATRLRRMPAAERYTVCASLAAQLLDGLHYAHSRDIVHRDVKLSNLLFFEDAGRLRVKIADFGLALRIVEASGSERAVVGTAAYMAPEILLEPAKAGPRSEVYAAAVCLYQMLCGRRPHEARRLSKMVFKILNEPPTPIRERDSSVPDELAAIIEKALSRSPDDRYQTAAEMRDALLQFHHTRSKP
ncbi:MAG: FHA domain-containing serine/threonine-protein kinase [Planctomycetaceae bacterium]